MILPVQTGKQTFTGVECPPPMRTSPAGEKDTIKAEQNEDLLRKETHGKINPYAAGG